jgi:peptidoglycan/xylan/chitin deacetylase (PgdA/CDA1 family)
VLVLTHPAGAEPERRYAAEVLLEERLGLEVRLQPAERTDVALTLAGEDGALVLGDDFLARPRLPEPPYAELDGVPLLYGGGSLEYADLFGSAFFLLTRWEETVVATRDGRDRFAAAGSVLARDGLLQRPLVDEYVELLWHALVRVWPRLERRTSSFLVAPSHDVDWPRDPRPAWHGLLGAARRRDAAEVTGRVRAALHRRDPLDTFDYLMDESERRGLRSAFFFIPDRTLPLDGDYSLDDPWLRQLLRRIHERGHEVGLHTSYATFRDPERTRREWELLARVCEQERIEQPRWGGRQHYLRWENPTTWRNWDEAGLDYDSTLGFHDAVGFRCGTCHDFPVFDLERRRRLRLRERPLVAMESSLLDVPGATAASTAAALAEVREQCRSFGGTFTLLWHNSRLFSRPQRTLYEGALGPV